MTISNIYPQHVAMYNIKRCYLCKKKFKVKIGDVIVSKRAKHTKLAHPNCAIKKNWVTKEEINRAERIRPEFIKMVS